LRYHIIILLTFVSIYLCSQTNYVLSDSILPNTKGSERNPLSLVTKLIENKKTDKEKFDMIFTWVTKNIQYDYYTYLAPTGSALPQLDRILKYKAGICMDYAYLMDTLCELAGIRNVSIYGYAKDDLFDVRDSIYMDNHAWNAVKLDNYWYVYDVTWSSGEYKWGYKKFSVRIINWRKKILARVKQKVVTFKSAFKTECDSGEGTCRKVIYTLSRKDRFLLKILSKFKLKKRRVFTKVARPDYYLSNPEVFAITHFPDNPYWSLVATQKKH
jgi:transglutaminase/protease-like cytokinesis protein 3